jgi:hypothetical protein
MLGVSQRARIFVCMTNEGTAVSDHDDVLIGRLLGRGEVMKLLGAGGAAVIHRQAGERLVLRPARTTAGVNAAIDIALDLSDAARKPTDRRMMAR